MDDLEITKLCAEALGFEFRGERGNFYYARDGIYEFAFCPLRDGTDAFTLVKCLKLCLEPPMTIGNLWMCWKPSKPEQARVENEDLNRAICAFVAKMQSATAEASAGKTTNVEAK